LVPGCSGEYRVFSPLPETFRCGTPRRARVKSLTFSSHSSSQRVIKQGRQDGAVALLLDGFIAGRGEQLTGLMVAQRRRLAFAALGLRALDAAP